MPRKEAGTEVSYVKCLEKKLTKEVKFILSIERCE